MKKFKFAFLIVFLFNLLITANITFSNEITGFGINNDIEHRTFVSKAGTLDKDIFVLFFYIDGDVLPPAIMGGIQYGISEWVTIGFDIGGDYGVFQTLINTRLQILNSAETFFIGLHAKTGFKYHVAEFSPELRFDDVSWIINADITLSFRLTEHKDRALYFNLAFYTDIDLRNPQRQTDYYVTPALLGYESYFSNTVRFFLEGGWMYSINGQEMSDGTVLYEKQGFAVFKFGIGIILNNNDNI